MEELWERWPRTITGLAVGAVVVLVVGALDVAVFEQNWFLSQEHWLRGVLTELNGAVFDVLLFGVGLVWFDEWQSKREDVRRWHEELEDFRGWMDSDESARRTAGLVRRISQARAQVYAGYANLNGANLTARADEAGRVVGLNLHRSVLNSADLREADLRKANLAEAQLHGARLQGAELAWAELSGANLGSADLSRSDLTEANLIGANLKRAVLDGAELDGANLEGATRHKSDPPINGWRLSNIDDGGIGRLEPEDQPDE